MTYKKQTNTRRKYYSHKSNDDSPLSPEDTLRILSYSIPKAPPQKPKIEDFKLSEKTFLGYEEHPDRAERHRNFRFGCFSIIQTWCAIWLLGWIVSTIEPRYEILTLEICFAMSLIAWVVFIFFSERSNKIEAYDSYKSCLRRYEQDCKKYYELLQRKEEAERIVREKEMLLKAFIDGGEGGQYLLSFSEKLKSSDVFRYRTEETWRNMTPTEFEYGVADIYARLGYNVRITKQSDDGGVDVILTKDGQTIYVQCKHYAESTLVPVHDVREFFGVCMRDMFDGIFVHTSSLTPRAQEYVSSPRVNEHLSFVSLKQLMKLEKKGQAALLDNNTSVSTSLDFLRDVINNPSFIDCRYYWLYNRIFDSLNSASKPVKQLRIWEGMQYAIVSDTPVSIESPIFVIILGTKEAIRQLSFRDTVQELFPQ